MENAKTTIKLQYNVYWFHLYNLAHCCIRIILSMLPS